ncbi:uncharacterized protein PAC_01281 [Phialocephala subalpina]|uniref:Zn(2)-C6 fungal-type domain-containing protein n=1 Tax=Phialocephala subalpina TaxID=576137 RepID=A0A1L7WF66_9HELO|nr:uncharacterized protein PAC_01281 [Phialocephala subalpina]
MDSSITESSNKRKRTPSAEDSGRASAPPPPQATASTAPAISINYLSKEKAVRLRLVEGDAAAFKDIIAHLAEYEGVILRHESLAGNLGANLLAPMMLRGLEKMFDNAPQVITAPFDASQSPITWLDVVTFAGTNPGEFILSEVEPGVQVCRCWVRGARVEVSLDDFRLIKSGGPAKFISAEPMAEDETVELETIRIIQSRLQSLIKQADAVAGKARQLDWQLKGRKKDLIARKTVDPRSVDSESRTFSPQPFPAVNARSSNLPNGEASNLQSELLSHYTSLDSQTSYDHRTSLPPSRDSRPKPGRLSTSDTFKTDSPEARRNSQAHNSDDGSDRRAIMATKIEKLKRGDPIQPKCDRCRRLKFECTKHLTACQACTKKHAKCSWKDATDEELEMDPYASMVTPRASERPTTSTGNGYLPAETPSQPRTASSINSYTSAEGPSRHRATPAANPYASADDLDLPHPSLNTSRGPSTADTSHFTSADSSLFAQSGTRTAVPASARQPILSVNNREMMDGDESNSSQTRSLEEIARVARGNGDRE